MGRGRRRSSYAAINRARQRIEAEERSAFEHMPRAGRMPIQSVYESLVAKRFLVGITGLVGSEHPFNHCTVSDEPKAGRAGTALLRHNTSLNYVADNGLDLQEMRDILEAIIGKFPERLSGKVGSVAILGATQGNGRRYVGFYVDGEAHQRLLEEQQIILDELGVIGMLQEPFMSLRNTRNPYEAEAFQTYLKTSLSGDINLTFGPPELQSIVGNRR